MIRLTNMLDDLKIFCRYAWGLNDYLNKPLTPAACRTALTSQLERREESFLRILKSGVYDNPRSPYARLLAHAGAEFGDVAERVRRHGIERVLSDLYNEGVYVTLDEFKGRKPVCRSGLEFTTEPSDFDNPFLGTFYEAKSSGSRSVGTRIIIDLDLLTHESAYFYEFLCSFGLTDRPRGAWREIPPVAAGMKLVLRYAKLGMPIEKWFSQSKLTFEMKNMKFYIFTKYSLFASGIFGHQLPSPEHVPFSWAWKIAEWLERKKRDGKPALMDTNVSSGVRLCLAAKEMGIDISGTFFRLGGEPYTEAKASIVEEAGCSACCHYSMTEVGTIGLACSAPRNLDEVHLLTDKLAVIQQRKLFGADGRDVGALFYTTVLPLCPKLMLNVESDDYGVLEERECGCGIGALGYSVHLSGIRSYEKLTSEGVSFLGTELLRLVEEVLPARFGGSPTDYQLVEEDVDGLPKVSIVINPRLRELDERVVIDTVFKSLESCPGGEIMAGKWRDGNTVRVLRREPYATASAKILPLHILKHSGN
jgi:hypothetical protein